MKKLQKSDLKEGEIYIAQYKEHCYRGKYIVKINNNICNCFNIYTNIGMLYRNGNFSNVNLDYCEATPEEKHWLETCIKADEFISYEEAMKTFIPEYVECIKAFAGITIGKILPVKNNMIIDGTFNNYSIKANNIYNYLKPSTKESYDAQFVVKEPEFVLPEIWWIKITKENLKDISKFLNFNLGENTIGLIAGMVKSYKTGTITKGYNSTPTTSYGSTFGNEITLEQFKKYVLKENTTVTEEPKVVLEEPKDKVLTKFLDNQIIQVECSEGGVYKIGDKIKVFGGSKNPVFRNKQYFTIKSFRWSNDKSKICAITESHISNGIGLDKIELYVEPKVKQELSLLEQAKLKYPIGTKFKVACQPYVICTVLNHDTYYFQTEEICNLYVEEQNCSVNGATVYYKGKWAEIVEDFVLPEKWAIIITNENKDIVNNYRKSIFNNANISCNLDVNNVHLSDRYDGTYYHYNKYYFKEHTNCEEITTEQFKKYVLKNE